MKDTLSTVAENLLEDQKKLTRLYQRIPFYLEEIAGELLERGALEVGDEELALSFRQMQEELEAHLAEKLYSPETLEPLTKELLSAMRPILSAELAKILTKRVRITRYLSPYENTPARIAYVRNAYSDAAYRQFSKELTEPTVLYRESFAAVCEELYADRCDFAILPVESSRDGKLSVTEKLVARYELAPVFYCTVPTTDDGTLRFGLFSSAPMLPKHADSIEFILFAEGEKTLPQLLTSANSLGAFLKSVAILAPTHGFRHEWRLVFGASDNSLDALWVLLHCEYPHHLLCGVCQVLS